MRIIVRKVLGDDCRSRLKLSIDGVDCSRIETYEKVQLVERFARLLGLQSRFGFYSEMLMIDDDFTDDYFTRCACDNISSQVSLEVKRYEKKKNCKQKKRSKAFRCYDSDKKEASSYARR